MALQLGRTTVDVLTNKSGGAVAYGDVVVIDLANAGAVTTTTVSGYTTSQPAVCMEKNGVANNGSGVFAFAGPVGQINLNAAASLGDFVKCHSVAKQGTPHAAPRVSGDFAEVKGTGTSPAAILFGNTFVSSGGDVATDAIFNAKGDLPVGTGADTAAALTVGANGKALVADSAQATGLKYANYQAVPFITSAAEGDLSAEVVIPGLAGSADIAGAGGAGVAYEFDSGASPLTWNAAVDVENVNSTIKSHLFVQDNGGTENYGLYAWSPAGAFDIRMKISIGDEVAGTAGVFGVGLVVGDSAMANRVRIFLCHSGTDDNYSVRAYTYAASTYTQRGANLTIGSNWAYLRITRDGSNNNSFYYSGDGLLWTLIATQALTYTAGKAGLIYSQPSAVIQSMAVDWIRSDV